MPVNTAVTIIIVIIIISPSPQKNTISRYEEPLFTEGETEAQRGAELSPGSLTLTAPHRVRRQRWLCKDQPGARHVPNYLLNESLRAGALSVWTVWMGPGGGPPGRGSSRAGGVCSHCPSGCPHEDWA